jgi:phasin family protein
MFNSNNQFFDSMKSFFNPEYMMNSMKGVPAADFSSFSNMIKKNAEVITAANQLAAESAQSILKRTAEVFQSNATELFNAMRENSNTSDPEQLRTRQQELIKNSFSSSVNNANEILDMAIKSTKEIFQVVTNSMSENVNEAFDKAQNSNKA